MMVALAPQVAAGETIEAFCDGHRTASPRLSRWLVAAHDGTLLHGGDLISLHVARRAHSEA
jgi:hypothetical protein